MLPSTGISTTLVGNNIGSSSRSIKGLVANAKHGGSYGYAFWIRENALDRGLEGQLIDNSLPYWNIFSDDSPGEFYMQGGNTTQGEIKFRLKRPPVQPDNKIYSFPLGGFRNYNSAAEQASIYGKTYLEVVSFEGTYTPLILDYYIDLGSYSWTKLLGTTTGCLGVFLYTSDNKLLDYGSKVFDPTNISEQHNIKWTMPLNIVKTLYDGQLLYPKVFIARYPGQLTNPNDGFIIRNIDTSSATGTIHKVNISDPTFSTFQIYDSVRGATWTEANGVKYNRPTLKRGNPDITVTGISSSVFTVAYSKKRYIQFRENGGDWKGATDGGSGNINGSSSYTAYVTVPGGLSQGKAYDVRVYVGDIPPIE